VRKTGGNLEVYSFYEYIEDSKKFIENIKELGELYQNDDMINSILKVNNEIISPFFGR